MAYPFDEEDDLLGPVPAEAPPAPPAMNPLVSDYLRKKYFGDALSNEARSKIVQDNEASQQGPNWAAGFAALGAGIAGRDATAAGQSVLSRQDAQRKSKLDEFDKSRSTALQDFSLDRDLTRASREDRDDAAKQSQTLRERDAASEESKLAQTLAQRMLPSRDFSGMTAEQINKQLPSLQKLYEIEQKKLDRQEAREERRHQYGIRAGDKADQRIEKLKEKELQLAVPGYQRTGEVLPRPEEAQKLRKAVANAEQLTSKLTRLRDLVASNGSFEMGGQSGTEMESLATEIQLLSKGDDMYQLGVLTGPDMALLNKITADPASLSSLFTRDSTRTKQIDTQLKSIAEKLSSVTKASGYAPSVPTPSGPAEVERKTKDGRTAIFDAKTKQFLRYK